MESEKQTFNKYQPLMPDMAPESFKKDSMQGYLDPNLKASQDEMDYYQDKSSYLKQITSHSGEYNRTINDTTALSQEDSTFYELDEVYIPTEIKRKLGSNILAKFGIHR